MPIKTIPQVLTEIVTTAIDKAGLQGILPHIDLVVPTKNPKFGDFQSNHAFRIGKTKRVNHREIAMQVKQAIPTHEAISGVDVAGPGFLNFFVSNSWLSKKLKEQSEHPHLGIVQSGSEKTMVIDYSSPNVAKRMHIGHMRSTIIGNAIDRIYRSMGWKVIADNHIGDWGTQFGKLIVSWREQVDLANFEKDPIGELERLYVSFSQNETEEKAQMARHETAKLQAGDPENHNLWKRFISVSLKEFDRVYERLDIHFDETLGESAYNNSLQDVISKLVSFDIATESDGAVVVQFPEDHAKKSLRNSTLVIRKKDGAFLYGTTDLATLEYRLKNWSPDQIIYVTDMRQQLHFQQVFHAWQAWRTKRGDSNLNLPLLTHLWFGMLKLPEGAMSTRKGNVIRLVDLLDESVRRARSVVDEKSPHLSETEREVIAEKVGLGAIRYFDLSQNPQSEVKFSWERILTLEGNTAPFLMYSYARGRGIQRKGEIDQPDVKHLDIADDVERSLALHLLKFPDVVSLAGSSCKPNLLCDHLYETANLFNRFYNANSVLRAPTEQIKNSRLALVEASLRNLAKGLQLLGITALGRM